MTEAARYLCARFRCVIGYLAVFWLFLFAGVQATLAETAMCSGASVVLEEHSFDAQPATCIATQSLQLGPGVNVPGDGDVAVAAPRVELRAPFRVDAGGVFSAESLTAWPSNQAVLGPLAGAEIAA